MYLLSDPATQNSIKFEFFKRETFRKEVLAEIENLYQNNENLLMDKYSEKRKNFGLLKANVSNLEGIYIEKRLIEALNSRMTKKNVSNTNASALEKSGEVNEGSSKQKSSVDQRGNENQQINSKLKRFFKSSKQSLNIAGGFIVPPSDRFNFRAIVSSKPRTVNTDEFSLRSKILSNLKGI